MATPRPEQMSPPTSSPRTDTSTSQPTSPTPHVEPASSPQNQNEPTSSPRIEPDPEILVDDDADSAFDAASVVSSTASLSESIFDYRKLNGRTYQSTNTTEYWCPNDEQQNEGLELIHNGLLMLLGNELFFAPISDSIHRALDVGTGTGNWAIDFADQFPSAEVTGTDISPIQPSWVPPNVKFEIDDCLLEWSWPDNHFDYIHVRALYGVIPDWAELYRKAFRHLSPGGWFEDLEMEVQLESDHVVFPADHIFNRWARTMEEAGRRTGRPFDIARGHTMKQHMEDAGFVDIVEKKMKTPLHAWPKDPKLREAGFILQEAFDHSLDGFGTFLFTQVLGMSNAEAILLIAEMRKESRKRNNFVWFTTTIVYGRKP